MQNTQKKIPAIILAAGQGKRLLPITEEIPKALVKVGNRPILEYVLLNLIRTGVRHFFIVTGYKSNMVQDWIYDKFCIDIYNKHEKELGFEAGPLGFSFIFQEKRNGTGGATLLCEKHIIENGYDDFILTYGDVLANFSIYKKLYTIYQEEEHDLYLVGNPTDDPSLGAAVFYKNNRIIDMIEKPDKNAPYTDINNSGIYIFKKDIFEKLKYTELSIRGEIELTAPIIEMIHSGKDVRLVKMGKTDFWCDVGTADIVHNLNKNTIWKQNMF